MTPGVEMRSQPTANAEHGFSLVELLTAILITLIVTGAMYGLLAQGQNAFRREPEMSDRQQQIRVAMDLIQRDIATAGMSMPLWVQAFTPALDGAGGAAVPPSVNAQGLATDYLEIIGYDGACSAVPLCVVPAGLGTVETNGPLPNCYTPATGQLVLTRPGVGASGASIGVGSATAPGGGCNVPPNVGVAVTVGPAVRPAAWDVPADTGPGPATATGDMKPVQIVRYQIIVDPVSNVPSLWRSARGGLDVTTLLPVAPGAAGSDWQLVASGIEDLQVSYRDGLGLPAAPAWAPSARLVVQNDFSTVVREVRITLGARTTGQQILQGESLSVAGVAAIRGQLTSVTAPRAALFALSTQVPAPPDPQSVQVWR